MSESQSQSLRQWLSFLAWRVRLRSRCPQSGCSAAESRSHQRRLRRGLCPGTNTCCWRAGRLLRLPTAGTNKGNTSPTTNIPSNPPKPSSCYNNHHPRCPHHRIILQLRFSIASPRIEASGCLHAHSTFPSYMSSQSELRVLAPTCCPSITR